MVIAIIVTMFLITFVSGLIIFGIPALIKWFKEE